MHEERIRDLGHDHDFFTWQAELLDRISEDDLGETIRVDLCGSSSVVENPEFKMSAHTFAVSNVWIPWSYLPFRCSCVSPSEGRKTHESLTQT